VRPHKGFITVGKLPFHALNRNLHRLESRDEIDEVDVVAADVGKRIRTVAGEPILEIRMTVIVGLNQFRFAHDERTELSQAVGAAGHQRAAVEPFVVFDANKAAFFHRQLFDLHCLFVLEHQGLHT